MRASLKFILISAIILMSDYLHALPLTPVEEPKADSFYICYEKRCPNNISQGVFMNYTKYKYVGCIISKTPCHLYCGDKGTAAPNTPLLQFQWVNTYPAALNSFYRCAYS